MTDETHSRSDDESANGEVVYRVSTAAEQESTDTGLRAVWVAQDITDMITAGMLPGFVRAQADGCGRMLLVVDVVAAALIAQAFAQEPEAGT